MLSRMLARSVRSAAVTRLSPASASWRVSPAAGPSAWIRGMAKDNKPGSSSRFGSPQHSQTPERSHDSEPSPPSSSQADPQRNAQESAPTNAVETDPSSPSGPKSTPSPVPDSSTDAQGSQPGKQIPFNELPDLTQGIPSTLEYETASATGRSSLAPVEEDPSSGGRGKGELPASAYVSSSERKRAKFANYAFGISALFIGTATVYAGRNWDEEESKRHPDVPNGWGLGLWWSRASARTKEMLTYYHEPAFDKLLPDPDPMFERPYTLCISLEDLLVHSEWSREHGWRVAKRPGVDYFLHYLSQYYELVLFTTVPFAIGEPLVRKLDPFRFIVWPLYREATKYEDGEVLKDLSYLNRDLSKVIIIDTNARHVRAQPENAIVLPKWTGEAKDNDLVALIPFLEYIYAMQYGDVRKVLQSFEGKHIPTEFARREAIARAEFQKQMEAQGKHKAKSGIGALGSLLGLKPSNMSLMVSPDGEPNPGEEFAKGKMLQDIVRERGQRTYEMMEKEIRENGEKWLKEEAAQMEKAQQEAMQSMKSSFSGWFVNPNDAKPSAPSQEQSKS